MTDTPLPLRPGPRDTQVRQRVTVTGVVSVSDQTDPGASPVLYAQASGRAKDSPDVPVQPGTLDVSADVVVVFSYA